MDPRITKKHEKISRMLTNPTPYSRITQKHEKVSGMLTNATSNPRITQPEAQGPQCSPECTAIQGYIQLKYCKCCMQEKLTFHLPWQLIKFSSLDLIHMVVRGLLEEH